MYDCLSTCLQTPINFNIQMLISFVILTDATNISSMMVIVGNQ
jgi:hypothetical protein